MPLLADASLPGLTEAFPSPFKLTLYHTPAEIPSLLTGQDILLCRSTLAANRALIGDHSLKIVATASSGTDHIDSAFLAERGISLLDAKGSNAVSVADYVLSCLAYLKTSLGFHGRKAGIIGAGAVGEEVATRLQAIGFNVINYDPLKALNKPNFKSATLSHLFDCELICVHANHHNKPPYPSINLLDEAFFKQLRPGTVILNAARGGIVNEDALLNVGKSLIYCTDVYLNEPFIDSRIVQLATLCTPHIAGHSIEAKQRAVTLISEKLHAYYHVPCPIFLQEREQQKPELAITPLTSWECVVLSLYNPADETKKLKNAAVRAFDLTFQRMREAHHYRHEFKRYTISTVDKRLNLILGNR
ncbi:MAG: erythronate-4-phosphate dehydrogenase [Legionellales bacterium RIFCSPHIGHO2_12_FULL_42_9]|nr:MAG: erythronate-4-phosphate dehydrogenase [Legionellales bacterium RIFCSPHIGHO2_12_FULL_42_9]